MSGRLTLRLLRLDWGAQQTPQTSFPHLASSCPSSRLSVRPGINSSPLSSPMKNIQQSIIVNQHQRIILPRFFGLFVREVALLSDDTSALPSRRHDGKVACYCSSRDGPQGCSGRNYFGDSKDQGRYSKRDAAGRACGTARARSHCRSTGSGGREGVGDRDDCRLAVGLCRQLKDASTSAPASQSASSTESSTSDIVKGDG